MFLVMIKAKKAVLGPKGSTFVLFCFGTLKLRTHSKENPRRFEVLLLFLSFEWAPTYTVPGLFLPLQEG